LKKEQEKGADGVSFKHCEKGALTTEHSCCGTYLIEVTFSLDCALVTNPNVRQQKKLRDKSDCDVCFPVIDARKLTMEDGCSSTDEHNPVLSSIMHEAVVAWMIKIEDKKHKAINGELPEKNMEEEAGQCDFCGDMSCIWSTECNRVIADDEVEQGHAVENRTRRKHAFRHMFRVTNGGPPGQKGVRKRHPQCIEIGIRALCPPDAVFMGHKEDQNFALKAAEKQ
jgi:hypothetical protein